MKDVFGIHKIADKLAKQAAKMMPFCDVGVRHSTNKAGHSCYITISLIRHNRWRLAKIRVSDHELGTYKYNVRPLYHAKNYEDGMAILDGVKDGFVELATAPVRDIFVYQKNGMPYSGEVFTDDRLRSWAVANGKKKDRLIVKTIVEV